VNNTEPQDSETPDSPYPESAREIVKGNVMFLLPLALLALLGLFVLVIALTS